MFEKHHGIEKEENARFCARAVRYELTMMVLVLVLPILLLTPSRTLKVQWLRLTPFRILAGYLITGS